MASPAQGIPHPRFYGTFPRVLSHYARQLALIPLETAIHKMTGATAAALKLADRGLLKVGYRADVAVFDPADFEERATYADPHRYPSGPRTTVLVNGVLGCRKRGPYRRLARQGVAPRCRRRGALREIIG